MDALQETAARNHIQQVAIIDDAYDSPSTHDLLKEDYERFLDLLEANGEDGGASLTAAFCNEFEISLEEFPSLEDLNDDEGLKGRLWRKYNEEKSNEENPIPHLISTLFQNFIKISRDKMSRIEPLLNLLEESDIKFKLYGSEFDPAELKDFPVVIIDCYLDFEVGLQGASTLDEVERRKSDAVDRAIGRIAEICDIRGSDDAPSVILMSDLADNEVARRFREESKLLACRFRFFKKEWFGDRTLEFIFGLMDIFESYADVCAIEAFLSNWKSAAENALEESWKSILELDLPDYGYLRKYRLEAEGTGLGDYMGWMFSAYLQARVGKDSHLLKAQHDANRLAFDQLPTALFGPSGSIADMYSTIRIQADRGYRGPRNSWVHSGDLFFRTNRRRTNDRSKEILAVVSPQCDLVAQNPRVPSEQVLLVSGQTVPLIHASWRDHDFVRIDDELHAIKWDLAKIHTSAYGDFTPAKLRKNGLKWFGELRGQYFIQLQRRVLENIGRVGLPTDPFLPFPLECYVFAKGANGKARLLRSYTSEDQMAFGSNAHMMPSGKPKSVHQSVYMFDRQVSFDIAEKLKDFLKSKTLSSSTRQQLEVALTKLLEFRNLHTPMTPPEFQKKLDSIVVKKEAIRKTKNLKTAISKPILIEIIHPAPS